MKFSIIVPSYNQDRYIAKTFENLKRLKEEAKRHNIDIEILLFDNQSNDPTQKIIEKYKNIFDYIEIAKDKGQYDAINKGINKATGDYWTWLNTDDLIEIDGFLKLADIIKTNPVDYIYGTIIFIDEEDREFKINHSTVLTFNKMINSNPGIYQQGSFFRRAFTEKIGLLNDYVCSFDYEYVLRILKNNGKLFACNFPVARFRIHKNAKTKAITVKFVKEQLAISKMNGRRFFSKLTFIAFLRLVKHRLYGTY